MSKFFLEFLPCVR